MSRSLHQLRSSSVLGIHAISPSSPAKWRQKPTCSQLTGSPVMKQGTAPAFADTKQTDRDEPIDTAKEPVKIDQKPPKAPAAAARPWVDKFRPFRHVEEEGAGDVSFGATYSILFQTLLIVCVIIAAKLLLREFAGWKGEADLSEISVVFTGLFFIMGQMFSNVNSELKEAEKMPMDIVSSLDQLQDHFVMGASKISDKVNILEVQKLLVEFARTWRDMLMSENQGDEEEEDCEEDESGGNEEDTVLFQTTHQRRRAPAFQRKKHATYGDCLNCLADLMDLMRDWENKGGVNLTYVPLAIDKLRKAISRGTVIKRTDVLPAAGALLNFFVLMSCLLLFLATYKTELALSIVIACVMTVCIFMARIIQSMDDPFKMREPTAVQRWLVGHMSAVKMFPIVEYINRMETIISEAEQMTHPSD